MKRKVIQIAESTQLISLPRKWCLKNKIKKGDELEVIPEGTRLEVSCKPETSLEVAELSIKEYGLLSRRVIHALYKKGVDEIRILFEKPGDVKLVQDALHNETVGYEIVEQSARSCLIKNISSNIMGFENMIRRTFLLLINMAEETANMLANKEIDQLNTLVALESSNNRFTTLCRRYLNKVGAPGKKKVGPYYTIVEELEKIADEYKYLIISISKLDKKDVKVTKNIIDAYKSNAKMIKVFHDIFYKFDPTKVAEMGLIRKEFVTNWYKAIETHGGVSSAIFDHHALVIMQKIFTLLGPLLILNSISGPQDS